MRRLFLCFVIFLLIFTEAIFAISIPRPNHNYYDELNMLSEETKAYIDASDKQIVVATIRDLNGEDPHDFGVRLFDDWGIGRDKADDGVLLLIAFDPIEDKRYVRIITGAGREAVITDAKAGRIIDEYMLDDLKNGNYDSAILSGFKELEKYYEYEDYEPDSNMKFGFISYVIIALLGLTLVFNLMQFNVSISKTRESMRKGVTYSFIGTIFNIGSIVLSYLFDHRFLILAIFFLFLFNKRRGFMYGTGSSSGGSGFSGGGFSGGSSFGGGSTSGGGAGRSF